MILQLVVTLLVYLSHLNGNGGIGVNGYRGFLRFLPNSDLVPCPTSAEAEASSIDGDASYSDNNCWGTGRCGAFGHVNCLNRDSNAFGDAFDDIGQHHWNDALCRLDTDNDGKTNGDELGDSCCIWNAGDIPSRTTDIGHPSNGEIQPLHASCLLDGVPSSPSNLHIVDHSASIGQVVLAWDAYSPRNTCVCSFTLSMESNDENVSFNRTLDGLWPHVNGGAPVAPLTSLTQQSSDPVPSLPPQLIICDLPINISISFRLIAVNLAGSSEPSNEVILSSQPSASASSFATMSSSTLAIPACSETLTQLSAGATFVWSSWPTLPVSQTLACP
jgi:hypothetical protein